MARRRVPREARELFRTCIAAVAIPLVAVAVAASGCRPAGGALNDPTLTIAYGFDERVLGPTANMPARFLVFEPLVAYNTRFEIEGRLARSWERSPDYRHWTVHLRTDVRWHDGTPFTAHDVKFTFDLLAHPDVGLMGPAEVRVLDDSTYTVSFRQPQNALDDWTWHVYFPRHLLHDLDRARFHQWDFWVRPVGNGPFRYVRHMPKEMIELEANPDFYRGRSRIDRLRLRLGERSITQLLSGEVDVLSLSQTEVARVANDPRFRVYPTMRAWRTKVLVWNHRHVAFHDPAIRRALTLAIDRRTLYRVLHIPDQVPVIDAVFTYGQFGRREFPAPFPHDPVQAAALLDAAGWRDSDGDGIRDREGRPFRFELIATADDEAAAVFVQDQLRRIGVVAQIRSLDFSAGSDRVLSGRFEAAIFVSQLQNVYGERGLIGLLGEDSPLGYANPQVSALLAAARDAVAPDVLDSLYREVTAIFRADLPLTVLIPSVSSTVAHRRVRGLVSPYRVDPVWYAYDLWLEEER